MKRLKNDPMSLNATHRVDTASVDTEAVTGASSNVENIEALDRQIAASTPRYKTASGRKKAQENLIKAYDSEVASLEEQLGENFSDAARREMYDRMVGGPVKAMQEDCARCDELKGRRNTLVKKRIDQEKGVFLMSELCVFAEEFDYSRVENFADEIRQLKKTVKVGGDTHIIDIGSFSDEELRPLLDVVDRKMYVYNNLAFEACSPEQKALIKSGKAIVVDGKFVQRMNPVILSGTHGDEVKPVIEFTVAAKKASQESSKLEVSRDDMHIETMVNPAALKKGERTGASGIDINQLTPDGSYEHARKAQVIEAIPKFDNPYIIDFHNCHGNSKPYAYVGNMNQRNIEMAKELGLEKLIICDPKIADNTVLSDAIRHVKGDGMVIETSAQDSEQIAMRTALKFLHLSGVVGSGEYRSSIGLQAITKMKLPTRNRALKIFGFQLPEVDSPENIPNDGHCYQIINGTVIKIVQFRETKNGLIEEALSQEDRKSFDNMS